MFKFRSFVDEFCFKIMKKNKSILQEEWILLEILLVFLMKNQKTKPKTKIKTENSSSQFVSFLLIFPLLHFLINEYLEEEKKNLQEICNNNKKKIKQLIQFLNIFH